MNFKSPDIEYFSKMIETSKISSNDQTTFKTLKRYSTRLDHGIQFYSNQISASNNRAKVLDLGCGSGDTKNYLATCGMEDIVTLDIDGNIADIVGDGHTLPFKSSTFDLVISTAVTEHLHNPFVAYKEIWRVLKQDGLLLATVSFWEKWHDNSYFHCTPNGIHILCHSSALTLIDIWSGWGFIESVLSHSISKKLHPFAFFLQILFDRTLLFFKGKDAVVRHRLRTSGSFGILAQKQMIRVSGHTENI